MKQHITYLTSILTVIVMIVTLAATSSCSKEVSMTRVLVQDSIRHYYPLVQGTDLTLLWRMANVGNEPLVITDIQPSCGCIVSSPEEDLVIPVGKETLLKFTFNSEKNTGFVKHSIRIFGNIAPEGLTTLTFDLNVVPPALGSPDYEELRKNRDEFDVAAGVKESIDGETSQRGYWTNDNEYSRGYNKYYWRKGRK